MFGISGIEFAIIIIVAFLIFGPDKLPGVIKNVTHIWEVLKSLRQQADQVIKAEVVEPLKDIEASVNPFVEEGKSATEMLAKRLGIKPDEPKKAEKKTSETKDAPKDAPKSEAKDEAAKEEPAKDASVKDAPAESAGAKGADTKAESAGAKGADTKAESAEAKGADTKAAPAEAKDKDKAPTSKPKTESFADKKAALERAHREKQQAEQGGSGAPRAAGASDAQNAAPTTSPASSTADETAGE